MQILRTPAQAAQWLRDRVTGQLHTDSRKIQSGDAFIAWPGGVVDGRQYIAQALNQGATACLVEWQGVDAFGWSAELQRWTSLDVTLQDRVAAFDGLKAASGSIADAYFEHPSQALKVVAITGTNGKTSSAWWLAHAVEHLGSASAIVGTLGVGRVNDLRYTGMTTPDPVLLQAQFHALVEQRVQVCALEASSIGIAEHRLAGTQIHIALLTNFTQDHLDYHGSMDAYWQAKQALFEWPELQAAILNVDDPQGRALEALLASRTELRVWTIGLSPRANARHVAALDVRYEAGGLCMTVVCGDQQQTLQTPFVGHYNVSNLLGVIATLCELGYDLTQAVQACACLPAVPGRMQLLGEAPLVAVDYAHTPDALTKALQALEPLAHQREGALVCVFGCGGNRDASKRPLMAASAEQIADQLILTSDNPRHESAAQIIQHMQSGLQGKKRTQVIEDRAQAIQQAIIEAQENDVILIAGKGHESYQEIAGVQYAFSDVKHAQTALEQRRAHV